MAFVANRPFIKPGDLPNEALAWYSCRHPELIRAECTKWHDSLQLWLWFSPQGGNHSNVLAPRTQQALRFAALRWKNSRVACLQSEVGTKVFFELWSFVEKCSQIFQKFSGIRFVGPNKSRKIPTKISLQQKPKKKSLTSFCRRAARRECKQMQLYLRFFGGKTVPPHCGLVGASSTESRIANHTIPKIAGRKSPQIPQKRSKKWITVESQNIDSESPSESHPSNEKSDLGIARFESFWTARFSIQNRRLRATKGWRSGRLQQKSIAENNFDNPHPYRQKKCFHNTP